MTMDCQMVQAIMLIVGGLNAKIIKGIAGKEIKKYLPDNAIDG